MLTVFEVAKYFLSKSIPNSDRSITHLKLQKLVYYAQAWHMAIRGKPLFKEKIEAWVHGPVCPELYSYYKGFGFSVLSPPQKIVEIPKPERDLIDEVWQVYGSYSGATLEHLTHKEEPWLKARGSLSDNTPSNKEITLENMRNYYRKLLKGT